MLELIKNCKNPEILVITPLRVSDKISKETKISIKRNKVNFIWYSYSSNNNVAKNFSLALNEIKQIISLPKYTIKIDNDTEWNRNTLDKLYNELEKSDKNVAYSYCGFEYYGSINYKFPVSSFDSNRLRQNNYISSNSLFKTKVLEDIPLITDDKYKRLLDWATYLNLLNHGYIGVPSDGYFKAKSSKNSISAGSQEDFQIKRERVINDFCKLH